MADPARETHVCTCSDCEAVPYGDRCRFEAALLDLRETLARRLDAPRPRASVLFLIALADRIDEAIRDTDRAPS